MVNRATVEPWPTKLDGTPKRVGEMTSDEQRQVFRQAGARLQQAFERPETKAALVKLLKEDAP